MAHTRSPVGASHRATGHDNGPLLITSHIQSHTSEELSMPGSSHVATIVSGTRASVSATKLTSMNSFADGLPFTSSDVQALGRHTPAPSTTIFPPRYTSVLHMRVVPRSPHASKPVKSRDVLELASSIRIPVSSRGMGHLSMIDKGGDVAVVLAVSGAHRAARSATASALAVAAIFGREW